jgi:uncharacterized protein (DUF2141 family)
MKLTIGAILLLLGTSGAAAGLITVTVSNVRNGAGSVIVALHRESARFPSDWAGAVASARAPARNGIVTVTLPPVPDGRYALIVVHDEDDNGVMSKNFLGLPREGFGTSNNPRLMGPPRFEPALFDLSGDVTIAVRLTYF